MAKEIKEEKIKRLYLDVVIHFTGKKDKKPEDTNSNVKSIVKEVKDEIYEILTDKYDGEVTVKVNCQGIDLV